MTPSMPPEAGQARQRAGGPEGAGGLGSEERGGDGITGGRQWPGPSGATSWDLPATMVAEVQPFSPGADFGAQTREEHALADSGPVSFPSLL